MSKQEDDGLIVEIDPRQLNLTLEPEGERKAKPKSEDVEREEPAGKSDDIKPNDEAIEALQRQLDAMKAENERERAARVAKEREAAEARAQAQQTYGYAQQRDYDLVNTTINNDKSRSEAIKRELKIARETGDTDRESDLMLENARIGARMEQSEARKRQIEEDYRREQAKREREERAPAQADPFEAAIQGVSAKSQAWLRQHPECVTDDVMNAKVLLADKEARRKGLATDTPEYFSYIEERMGYRKPERSDDTSDESETRREDKSERRQSYAAPVSRDVPGSNLKPSQRRLTREQVETAEALGMTPAQYATWLAKAEKDNKYQNH